MDSGGSQFAVSLIAEGTANLQDSVHKSHVFEEKGESKWTHTSFRLRTSGVYYLVKNRGPKRDALNLTSTLYLLTGPE